MAFYDRVEAFNHARVGISKFRMWGVDVAHKDACWLSPPGVEGKLNPHESRVSIYYRTRADGVR